MTPDPGPLGRSTSGDDGCEPAAARSGSTGSSACEADEGGRRSRRANDARRVNARRSTGPRTQAGKERSSANARRHGLASPIRSCPRWSALACTIEEELVADALQQIAQMNGLVAGGKGASTPRPGPHPCIVDLQSLCSVAPEGGHQLRASAIALGDAYARIQRIRDRRLLLLQDSRRGILEPPVTMMIKIARGMGIWQSPAAPIPAQPGSALGRGRHQRSKGQSSSVFRHGRSAATGPAVSVPDEKEARTARLAQTAVVCAMVGAKPGGREPVDAEDLGLMDPEVRSLEEYERRARAALRRARGDYTAAIAACIAAVQVARHAADEDPGQQGRPTAMADAIRECQASQSPADPAERTCRTGQELESPDPISGPSPSRMGGPAVRAIRPAPPRWQANPKSPIPWMRHAALRRTLRVRARRHWFLSCAAMDGHEDAVQALSPILMLPVYGNPGTVAEVDPAAGSERVGEGAAGQPSGWKNEAGRGVPHPDPEAVEQANRIVEAIKEIKRQAEEARLAREAAEREGGSDANPEGDRSAASARENGGWEGDDRSQRGAGSPPSPEVPGDRRLKRLPGENPPPRPVPPRPVKPPSVAELQYLDRIEQARHAPPGRGTLSDPFIPQVIGPRRSFTY